MRKALKVTLPHAKLMTPMKRAFSLVELSIVLVILGLLVGGVLSGQSLIRAAELRSVSTDYQRYTAAAQTFHDKYLNLPGDMSNATAFWGAEGTCPSTNRTAKTLTCNGDGDGMVDYNTNETFAFWQHLANAGLIEGRYWGVAASTGINDAVAGSNVPRGKISSTCWYSWFGGEALVSYTDYFPGTIQHGYIFGKNDGAICQNPTLKPEEAWNIDTKLDDGKPGFGKITVLESQPTCHGGTLAAGQYDPATANYLLTTTDITCTLIIRDAY